MARKAGQLISRGSRTWLVCVSLGRDPETGTRKSTRPFEATAIHGIYDAAAPVPDAVMTEPSAAFLGEIRGIVTSAIRGL